MQNILTKNSVKSRALLAFIAIASAVVLPQIFHALGALSGLGTSLGAAFLPMHLPLILAGLFGGPIVGLVAGAVSPVLSFSISGMPTLSSLPLMTIELAVYGVASGFLKNSKMPVVAKVLLAQIAGRIVRGVAVVFAIYVLGSAMPISATYSYLLIGLIGVLLQLVLIPLIVYRVCPKTADSQNSEK